MLSFPVTGPVTTVPHFPLLESIFAVVDGSEPLVLVQPCSFFRLHTTMTSGSFSCELYKACFSRPLEPGCVASLCLCVRIQRCFRALCISALRQWSPKHVSPVPLLRSTIFRSSGEVLHWPPRSLSRETTVTAPSVSSRPNSRQSWIAG